MAMSSSNYSALLSGDEVDAVAISPAVGSSFVPLGRGAVPTDDSDAPVAALAAAAAGGGVAATKMMRRAVRKTIAVNRLRKLQPEVVTLTVHAHGFLDSVSYAGMPVEGLDTEVGGGVGLTPDAVQKLTFCPAPGGVLTIASRSTTELSTKHGNLRSLMFMCESTRSDSPWNFAITPQNATFFVRAMAVPKEESKEQELTPKGWEENQFDDSEWGVPTSIADAGCTVDWDGTEPWQFPRAEAVWFGPELKALFRFDVSSKFEAENRKSAPLCTAIVRRDPLHELEKLIKADPASELDAMQQRYSWLLALSLGSKVSAATLHSAVADRPHASVILSLLEKADPAATQERDPTGNTLLYQAVNHNLEEAVILDVLVRWPEAIKEKGIMGTPLYLAASNKLGAAKRRSFETQAQLLIASASFGRVSGDDLAEVGSSCCLRWLAKSLETPEGVEQFQSWLEATPNVLMCCLSLAHAMKHRIAMEPSRRVLFNRTAERLMDVATELGLCVDVKLSRIDDRKEEKVAVQALLQPSPLAILELAVQLHDIETVSVPWILDYVRTMDGRSLRFLSETWHEGGGTEMNPMAPGYSRPMTVEEVISTFGLVWPFELFTITMYLAAAHKNKLLAFRAPAARYWFDTGVYFTFVLSFSYALVLGPDTSGLGPVVTVYAWTWVVAALLQEVGQVHQSPRLYFEDFWNWPELASPLLVGSGLVFNELLDDTATARVVHSVALVILWIRMLQVFERSESVGPLVAVIGRMLKLLLQFLALALVFVAAWSVGMFALLRGNDDSSSEEWTTEYSSLSSSAFTMFRVYLGDSNYSFAGADHDVAAYAMYGAYLMLTSVLVLNLLIAILSAEHAQVYEDIEKEFAFTQAKATLRMQARVDKHELPPPLNLLQVPSTLWSGLRGRGWGGGGQRAAWLCWSMLALPVLVALSWVACLLLDIAVSLQIGAFPMVKEGIRFPVPLLIQLNPRGPWYKFLLGLYFGVLSPVLVEPLTKFLPAVLRLPVLPCKILLGMDVGLTFEVRCTHLLLSF